MINFARHLIAEVLSIVEAQLSGILRFLDGIASPIAQCIDFAFWLQCSISLGHSPEASGCSCKKSLCHSLVDCLLNDMFLLPYSFWLKVAFLQTALPLVSSVGMAARRCALHWGCLVCTGRQRKSAGLMPTQIALMIWLLHTCASFLQFWSSNALAPALYRRESS